MKIYLSDVTLPEYTEIQEITNPNAAEVYSLNGTLGVDYVNYMRYWKLSWKLMTYADYKIIRDKYNQQFATGIFHMLGIPDYSINVPVYIKISETNIKYNGQLVEGFSIELVEQYAIS